MNNTQLRVLVTGSPGAGKSTLVELLLKTIGSIGKDVVADLDWFGNHLPIGSERQTKWIVKAGSIQTLFQSPCPVWVFGTCANMYVSVPYVDSVPGLGTKLRAEKPIAYSLPWTHKILLVWDPTEDEYANRFGESRRNDYGKSEPTKSRVLQHAQGLYTLKAPREFTKVDVTGLTPIEALERIMDVVFDGHTTGDHGKYGETGNGANIQKHTSESCERTLGVGRGSMSVYAIPDNLPGLHEPCSARQTDEGVDPFEARSYSMRG